MIIEYLHWDEENIEHIARHQLTPDEVEEACFSQDPQPRIERGRYNRYYVMGKSAAGKFLFVVVEYLGKKECRIKTAREMEPSERRRFEGR